MLPEAGASRQPSSDVRHRQWVQHAFDLSDRAEMDIRSREWTAVAQDLSG